MIEKKQIPRDRAGHVLESIKNDKAYWENLLKEYHTLNGIAGVYKIDARTVSNIIKDLGIEVPSQKQIHLGIDQLKELIWESGGIRKAAKILKCSHTSILSKLTRSGLSYNDILTEYQDKIAPDWSQQVTKVYGDCMIAADFHIPFHSIIWVDRLIKIAQKENIKQIIIAGDFVDLDRLSFWITQSTAEDIAVKLEDEFAMAELVLDKMEEQFNKFYFIGGNHWLRLLKHITYSIKSKRLLGLVGRKDDRRYEFAELFDWLILNDKIRITHPRKGRKLDYTLARDISILFPEQTIIVTHRHRSLEGFTPSGSPMYEIGWMGDTNRMRYVYLTDSTYFRWINGFASCKNNIVRLYTEYNYDWEK